MSMMILAPKGDWSSGMIPALGAGGREFDSRITPFCSVSLHCQDLMLKFFFGM